MDDRLTKKDELLAAGLLFLIIFGLGFMNWLLDEGGHF